MKKVPIQITDTDHQRLFELKCAWRMKSYADTVHKLLEKAGNGGKIQ